jgi:hypothetical protein
MMLAIMVMTQGGCSDTPNAMWIDPATGVLFSCPPGNTRFNTMGDDGKPIYYCVPDDFPRACPAGQLLIVEKDPPNGAFSCSPMPTGAMSTGDGTATANGSHVYDTQGHTAIGNCGSTGPCTPE